MKKTIMIIATAMIQIATIAATPHHHQHGNALQQKEMAVVAREKAICNAEQQVRQKKVSVEERHTHMTQFVVNMLKLDEKTAAKFTPIYKDYLKAKSDLRHTGMKNRRPQNGNVTDAEAQKIVKERLSASRKIIDIREKYYNKMAKVITPTQLLKIYDMEQNFDNKMRSEWSNRSKMRHSGAQHSRQHQSGHKRTQNNSKK